MCSRLRGGCRVAVPDFWFHPFFSAHNTLWVWDLGPEARAHRAPWFLFISLVWHDGSGVLRTRHGTKTHSRHDARGNSHHQFLRSAATPLHRYSTWVGSFLDLPLVPVFLANRPVFGRRAEEIRSAFPSSITLPPFSQSSSPALALRLPFFCTHS